MCWKNKKIPRDLSSPLQLGEGGAACVCVCVECAPNGVVANVAEETWEQEDM